MRPAVILPRHPVLRHLLAAALVLLCAGPVHAEVGAVKITTTEDVVIAFYKSGGAKPNFTKWVEMREPYRTTALALRPEVMEREMARLEKAYASFDPARNFLTVKTRATARAAQYQDPDDPNGKISQLEISFPAGEADYFPYDFMDERFAVIPQDLATHLKPRLHNEQFEYMNNVLDRGKPVTMILELRPLKADMEAPFNLDGTGGGPDSDDGKGQWMFLTDIASISIWNKAGSLLWEYTAPWYITPVREGLMGLHTDKSTNSAE